MLYRKKDMNRRWHILQYLFERGAFDPLTAVPRRELLEAMGISKKTLSYLMRKLRSRGFIVAFPKRYNRYYFLGTAARNFLKKYPSFIDPPYYKREIE